VKPALKKIRKWFIRLSVAVLVLGIVGGLYMAYRINIDEAQAFDDPVEHFKYGSTGGDRNFGIPYVVWQALPVLFRDHLPEGREDLGWAAFGFVEEYVEGDDGTLVLKNGRPVGTSMRNYQGIERVFLNCAGCHAGTVRTSANGEVHVYAGMPANRIDLQAFQDFLIAVALDERFTPDNFMAQIDDMDLDVDFINRAALRFFGIYALRERILTIRHRFRFAEHEPAFGPGRFDTFSPAKALLNWPLDQIPEDERIGVVDFPSIWLQAPREGMKLHWDGNNTKVQERNRSAAFGTGALPPLLDRESVQKMENWLLTAEPPSFQALFPAHVDQSQLALGAQVYQEECADCHGQNGRDFSGAYVGEVTPIDKIGTDRGRLDNYTLDLALNQNVLYAEYGDERFQNFRKTNGYANAPLDGLWLRAPYLHNGSVPTLWDLLQPESQRPAVFYRGYEVYDPVNMGFESRPSAIPAERHGELFCFQVRDGAGSCAVEPDNNDACRFGRCSGNWNGGHDYGTTLPDSDKRALVEYLKTF